MFRTLLLLFFMLYLAVPAWAADATNNCHEQKAWEDWQARVSKHPEDNELHTLHALWLGFCMKVERGDLAFDEASALFEQTRRTLIQRRQDENQGKKPRAPL
jgi:hypothetical protein